MASPEQGDVASQQNGDGKDDGVYFDSEDTEEFEAAAPNIEVNFDDMVENYFARVDEIHQQHSDEEDAVLDFEDISA